MKDEDIEAGYLILEELRGRVSPEVIEEMQRRLLASPDEIREETRAEIEEEEAFQIDTIDIPPDFFVESDLQVTLGLKEHTRQITIRFLNGEDADRLSELVPDAWQYVSKRGRLSLEALPLNEVVDRLIAAAAGDTRKGMPTKFKYKFLECLAHCLSNPSTGQRVTVGFLRGCPSPQLIVAARRIWSVNHDFFTGPSGVLPGSIQNEIGIRTGQITRIGRLINEMMMTISQLLSGIGMTLSSGTTSSLTRWPVSTDSQRPKSDA